MQELQRSLATEESYAPIPLAPGLQVRPAVLVEESPLIRLVIGLAIQVHRQLGPGLLESVYRKAFANALVEAEIKFREQVPVSVIGLPAGYRADFIIEDQLLIELKSVERTLPVHRAQTLTYLRLLGLRNALLINFNVPLLKEGIRRLINTTSKQ